MTITRTILAVVAAAAFSLPVLASAQSITPAPNASPAPAGHHHGFGPGMRGLALSDDQQQQLKKLRDDYMTAHPRGSAPDKTARKALRDAMLQVLTPDQRTQYQANMKAAHDRHHDGDDTTHAGPFAPSPTATP